MTFRYGGDELLVIQPEMSEEAMVSLISKWQRAVGDITVEGVSEKISCSHGMVHDTPATADELRHMIKLADDALYREKTARGTLRRA
jgi:diguanylate cyclase (GGDEF)-like protein